MDNVANLRHWEAKERIEISHRVLSCPGNFLPHLNFNGPWPSGLTCNDTLGRPPSPVKTAMLMLCAQCCVNMGELASWTCTLPDDTSCQQQAIMHLVLTLCNTYFWVTKSCCSHIIPICCRNEQTQQSNVCDGAIRLQIEWPEYYHESILFYFIPGGDKSW